MVHTSFLNKLYFKSLTPFEVLKVSRQYSCSFEKKDDIDYLDYWKKNIAKDSSHDVFNKYFSANHLNHTDVTLMVSTISCLEEPIDFPIWIFTLEDILNSIDAELIMSMEHPQEEFYQFFYPYVDYFANELQQNLARSTVILTDNLTNQLNTFLYKGLFNITESVLIDECNQLKKNGSAGNLSDDFYDKKFIENTLSDQFQDLFLKYPMLARRLATKTYRYLNFITNLLKRFDSDQTDLASYFKIKPDLISKLHLGVGDQHHGESTVIVEFENADKVIYKPVNVSISDVYHQFLNWVNINLEEELKTFKVIDRNTYGWLQFVEHSQCQNIDEVKHYYERAGMLLGIAYFLNANDFHFENVIACGASPVLIDHETIVSPKLKTLDIEKREQKNSISGTVLETSLIPVKDLGLPFYRYGFGSSAPGMKELYKLNKPVYKDTIENLIDYGPEFKNGFKKLYDLILKNKVHLLSENSPVTNFSNLNIRFINRPTVVYYKLLKLLNQPVYLADPVKYGTKLEILARAYQTSENWPPILGAEREQLLLNDIPAFYISTLDNHLMLSDKKIFLIELSALENIYHKIKKAGAADYHNQLSLIEESIKI